MSKVIPMVNEYGNTVKNQYTFRDDDCLFFQSYDDIVAKIDQLQIYIDEKVYNNDISVTTLKWLCTFLELRDEEITNKINTGDILLIDLN